LEDKEGDGGDGGSSSKMDESMAKGMEVSDDMPRRYREVIIDFSSKRGLDAFDFGRYNTTPFSGLENILPNTYTNAVLQMLFFVPEVRLAILHQQYNPRLWDNDKSLGCELGFLFHMLNQARNGAGKVGAKPCQSANFLRVFRHIPEAVALGLLESKTIPVQQRVESFHRFLLNQLHLELAGTDADEEDRSSSSNKTRWTPTGKEGKGRETIFDSTSSDPMARTIER